ncbi:MAG: beta-N-acetylhexosaminidase [Bacteroidales bacterium]|jgi:hexosaminidase|nr:beta-N-acetylhexosaminidase [Bacteroidales bacterium]
MHNKKITLYFFLLYLLLVNSFNSTAQSSLINIVPQPAEINSVEVHHFFLKDNTNILFVNTNPEDPKIQYISQHLATVFSFYHFNITFQQEVCDTCMGIIFKINESEKTYLGNEGYDLVIHLNHITISANSSAGLVYGFQSLVQLAPPDVSVQPQDSLLLPVLHITDYPRFEWRGSHRDVSRHFFDVESIKKHLDLMVLYKLNKFHWHLTDDHGWRIEIDSYPKLTEIGAWSVDRSQQRWTEGTPPAEGEKATYGGFYTKKEIQEIVAYAAARNIDVIPEIEIPGHCSEILAAYPEFACDDYSYYVQIGPYWPPKAILCGGNDDVMVFLKKIIDEVVELFPCQYIHIGGDEAYKDNWKVCLKCQNKIKSLQLNNDEELQSWMIRDIEKHIMSYHKRIIGWDEILDGGVTPTATIMSWQGDKGGIKAAKQGNKVIMAPNSHCYLDYYQADKEDEPEAICCYIPLEKVYQFDPIPEALTDEEAKFVKGGQANLWAEFISNTAHAEYMLLPRLSALAEAVWTPKREKNWDNFITKLPTQKQRLKILGYNYCDKIGKIK